MPMQPCNTTTAGNGPPPLEGLRQWLPGRTDHYRALDDAVVATGFYDGAGQVIADGYRY